MCEVVSSYLLIATTSIDQRGYALRKLYVPKSIVTMSVLIYRYMMVFLEEAERIMEAYHRRAPGQKGRHMRVWGSLVGQLFLRSIDKAQLVYESMLLRGYQGEFIGGQKYKQEGRSLFYCLIWLFFIILFRIAPVFEVIGNMFI